MPETFDLVLKGGTVATPAGLVPADVGVREGRIARVGSLSGAAAGETVSVAGLHVLPGVIDSQVHLREPGLEHKEDLATGTAAAVLGGVTSVFDMPNTRPGTTTAALLADKMARAGSRAWCNYAFFVGATEDNADELGELERLPGCAGVKVFMGSSTGNLLVADDEALRLVLESVRRRVAVHAEDEARLRERLALVGEGADVALHPEWRDAETARRATERLMRLARETRRRVHVLHVSTAEEMDLLQEHRDIATVEVTPQHLTMNAPDCYRRLGTLAQMNPPIRDMRHRQALWEGVRQGVVDVIGSDHAPHTREEKARPYPNSPSGMPGVQTLVPVMLTHVADGRLSLERFIDLTSAGPARVYGIVGKGRIAAGYDADLTVVDCKAYRVIEESWIASRCGWSPFAGKSVRGWPRLTVVGGRIVMRDDELVGPPAGTPVRFLEAL
ncbi:MAG: dihydroorotase [Rhodospirillaceae bacterium]|nr:dihydroorotase [Rhodospirillaceae bacterium]